MKSLPRTALCIATLSLIGCDSQDFEKEFDCNGTKIKFNDYERFFEIGGVELSAKKDFDKNEDEWNDFGKELSSYVDVFEDNGMTLGYHNHAFEFNKLPSGKMPMECILDHNEKLKYEIDLGWVVAGKADPIYWTKKYASRIIACHLKDFSSADLNLISHNSQCAVGDGFIDWSSVIDEVKKTNCEIFALEHDDPKDYKEYTLRSIENLKDI